MAAYREGAGARKINLDRLPRRLLRRIEGHVSRIDIELMEKFIVVGEQDGVASRDRDVADHEGPPLLGDSVHRGSAGKTGGKQQYEQQGDTTATPAQFPNHCQEGWGKHRSEYKHSASMRVMSLRATWLFGLTMLVLPGVGAAQEIAVFANGFVDIGGGIPPPERSGRE